MCCGIESASGQCSRLALTDDTISVIDRESPEPGDGGSP
jgi:hypothetical protein